MENQTWYIASDEEMSALRDTIERLIHVATGDMPHRYGGACPDETNTYRARDLACPACQIILDAESLRNTNRRPTASQREDLDLGG